MDNVKLSKSQENKLNMFQDVENVLDTNAGIISGIPEFGNSVTVLKNVISAIQAKAVRKGSVVAGKALAKSVKRIELERTMIELASAVYAYGSKNGNEVLKAITAISQYTIDRLRDTEIPNKGEVLLNAIEENKEELVKYGIDNDDLIKLRNRIENYKTTSTEKSISVSEKTVITHSLGELFKTGMDTLENEIDKFVNSRRTKERDFYTAYYGVRSIKNIGIRHKKEPEVKN